MFHGNLATRPFYNDRLVNFALGILAAVALALTVFNAWSLITLTRERTRVRAELAALTEETRRISGRPAGQLPAADRTALARLAAATREANDLIDQRTFSWTRLFAHLEQTLPIDVRLLSVSPRLERGTMRVGLTVAARDLEDVDVLLQALLATGAFENIAPEEQQPTDDGTYIARLVASYQPPTPQGASAPGGAR